MPLQTVCLGSHHQLRRTVPYSRSAISVTESIAGKLHFRISAIGPPIAATPLARTAEYGRVDKEKR
jgi:hypothetical protein